MIIKLKNVRLAFSQNLFKPGVMPGSDTSKTPTYSSTFLLSKDDPQVEMVRKAIEAVAQKRWDKKAAAVLKDLINQDRICLRDGATKPEYDGFEGCMFIRANNPTKPLVIDKDRTELVESSGRPYPGCYVNCSLDIWPLDNPQQPTWGKRIPARLRGVQFLRDGDAFSGSAPATDDEFEDVGDTGSDIV